MCAARAVLATRHQDFPLDAQNLQTATFLQNKIRQIRSKDYAGFGFPVLLANIRRE